MSDRSQMEWATRTGVLGDQVAGIWPAMSDVTDVNCADLSPDGQVRERPKAVRERPKTYGDSNAVRLLQAVLPVRLGI